MKINAYNNLFLVIFFCLLSLKCSQKEKETGSARPVSNSIIIDESSIKDSYNINDIIDGIEVISLQESQDYLLAEINKLIVHNNQFIVCDMYKTGQVLLFDSAGSFVKKVVGTGNGPNQPLQISDFWKDDTNFFVYDHASKKIFVLDSNFNFVEAIGTNDDIYRKIRNVKNNKFVGYSSFNSYQEDFNGENYELVLLDSDFNKLKGYFPIPDKFNNTLMITYGSHFYKFSDTLRFIRPYDNTIYKFIDDELKVAYAINYKQNELTRENFEEIVSENTESFEKASSEGLAEVKSLLSGYSYFYNNLFENNELMTFTSMVDSRVVFTVYDKLKNKTLINANFLVEKDKYNIIIPKLTFANDDHFYGIIDVDYLEDYMLGESVLKKYNSTLSSNFLIVKVKFK